MKLRRSIKRQARMALRGRVPAAAALFLLWAAAQGAVSLGDRAVFRLLGHRLEWFGGAAVASALDWLVQPGAVWASAALAGARVVLLCPLRSGAAAWFSALIKGERRPMGTLFWPYGNRVWLRSLGVRLYAGALTAAVALIPLAGVGVALGLLRRRLLALPPPAIALTASLLGVAALGWLLVAGAYGQRFSMAALFLGPDYGCRTREALAFSVACTRGYRWRLVWMDLSFLPWFLSCLLVAPALYVLPYYAACRVGYGRYLARRWVSPARPAA